MPYSSDLERMGCIFLSVYRNNCTRAPLSVSQNFLTSRALINRLLRRTDISRSDLVLEIGAGKGHITRELLASGCRVLAVELDQALYKKLTGQFADQPNLRLVCGDFFKTQLPLGPYKVFSNIPFSRTTDILRRLTTATNPPQEAWLVLEKGAAHRFCGKPGETLQSLLLKPFFDTKILYYFRREDFHPAPRVDCVLLHLHRKAAPDIPASEREAWRRFLEHSLRYGICGSRGLLSRRQAAAALRRAGLEPLAPSSDILYVQWLCLFRYWRCSAQN